MIVLAALGAGMVMAAMMLVIDYFAEYVEYIDVVIAVVAFLIETRTV